MFQKVTWKIIFNSKYSILSTHVYIKIWAYSFKPLSRKILWPNTGKYGVEKTPYLETFCAVSFVDELFKL